MRFSHTSTIALADVDVVKLFERDPATDKLLWFSGPPIDMPDPSAYGLRYSTKYLAFLAKKYGGEKDGETEREAKRRKVDDDVEMAGEESVIHVPDEDDEDTTLRAIEGECCSLQSRDSGALTGRKALGDGLRAQITHVQ